LSIGVVVLTLVMLAVVIAVVSRPLLAPRTPKDASASAHAEGGSREGAPERHSPDGQAGRSIESDVQLREELEAAREAKYREIRDAELDYRTGKLSAEDYEVVNGTLRTEAVEILDRLEALEDRRRARNADDGPGLEGPAGSSTRVS
jgi:hypothetical protein